MHIIIVNTGSLWAKIQANTSGKLYAIQQEADAEKKL